MRVCLCVCEFGVLRSVLLPAPPRPAQPKKTHAALGQNIVKSRCDEFSSEASHQFLKPCARSQEIDWFNIYIFTYPMTFQRRRARVREKRGTCGHSHVCMVSAWDTHAHRLSEPRRWDKCLDTRAPSLSRTRTPFLLPADHARPCMMPAPQAASTYSPNGLRAAAARHSPPVERGRSC